MGTLANGIKDIFSTSQTTATHLPVCASDGTPQGRISVGDLASVLGVLVASKSSGSMDDLITPGLYTCYNLPDTPTANQTYFVKVTKYDNWVIQTAFNSGGSEVYYRLRTYQGVWYSWRNVTYDMPSFYKNYNSLSALVTAMAGNHRTGGNVALLSNIFQYEHTPTGEYEEGWKSAFKTWYDALTEGVIIAEIKTPGNGVLVGLKSSNLYGGFMWIGDGFKKFVWIDVSSGVVTTNYS